MLASVQAYACCEKLAASQAYQDTQQAPADINCMRCPSAGKGSGGQPAADQGLPARLPSALPTCASHSLLAGTHTSSFASKHEWWPLSSYQWSSQRKCTALLLSGCLSASLVYVSSAHSTPAFEGQQHCASSLVMQSTCMWGMPLEA